MLLIARRLALPTRGLAPILIKMMCLDPDRFRADRKTLWTSRGANSLE